MARKHDLHIDPNRLPPELRAQYEREAGEERRDRAWRKQMNWVGIKHRPPSLPKIRQHKPLPSQKNLFD